ncbi:adenosylcobinamide-GDP ribazoletransferase [Aliiroseovarius sp.]|uniref:adenosylcobinamide-GDP ribazoletransferase n=1 Tax=Aliiroseovarius sp. TaxID=1872442 RepID=UPI003BAA0C22
MTERDMRLATPGDIPAALGLLTRLPITVDFARAQARGAQAAWAWPLAGALVGLIAGMVGLATWSLGVPPGFAAGLALVTQAMLTGAMHEDGLADTADGLWGGYTRERRLEIMKDSAIGAYGTIALVLSLLLRFAALSALFATGQAVLALIAAGALSRAAMGVLMSSLPNARGEGLSDSVGRPPRTTAALGLGLALTLSVLLSGPAAWLASTLAASLAAFALASIAKAKIGGQTGDILGATQQVTEIAALAAFATLATG